MTRDEIITAILERTTAAGLDPQIAVAQAQAESSFNPQAVSSSGAQGLFQFMPATAAQYGLANPFDPVASIDARNAYMADLLRMFGGDYAKALAGYNWGQGRVERAAQQWGQAWLQHAPNETRNYVAKILNAVGRAANPTRPSPTTRPGEANRRRKK